MKRLALIVLVGMFLYSETVYAETNIGYMVTSDLWIRAVIDSVEKGPIEAVWQKGGVDTTSRGDRVIWGHFYASPSDVTWGSRNNPDLFVKIWFDANGRIDINFFHVSVPDIVVCSEYPYDGTPDEQGTTTTSRRYIRQYYEDGQNYSDENYEDGNPPCGYLPAGNPAGYSTINDLRIGAIINTVEKGAIDAVWRLGGQDTTVRGDQVVWGHFYAGPNDVTWGSENNPDLFVKIWFDVSGRVDVNFFHVSVPDIDTYSNFPDDGTYDQKGTTIMDNRYIRHEASGGFISPLSNGWSFEGKVIHDPYFFDVCVLRLEDGRYRLYGGPPGDGSVSHPVESYISDDGVVFRKEEGYRLTGAFMPFVVKLAGGGFRMYFTDQEIPIGAEGGRGIKSAFSNDGLQFTVEEGDRLVYTGDVYESLGIRGSKILELAGASYRMYYHGIDANNHWRVLSAISLDGLNWTREEGVRLDPADLCGAFTNPRIGNIAPLITTDGVYHLYVPVLRCDGANYLSGIYDTTSTDGLTFTVSDASIVMDYEATGYTAMAQDPAVVVTNNGLRMYFGLYDGPNVIPESGIYSIFNVL